jgi:two-component system CheB/CheR fusion protein
MVASNPPARTDRNVVGIGASAGGLAALRTFFEHLPEDTGLTFVVVVHLSPEHESHLADLLQPHVRMPVCQVTETVPLEANHVYVIPPNANLNSIDTHLRLSELEESRRERAPIDHFFRTLAKTHDGHAIGVILTGTGSDGALGIKEIKAKNGLTIVQDPNDAEYDGMPQSAIATGQVDLVLPLVSIPAAIVRFSQTQPRFDVATSDGAPVDASLQLLQRIFVQVRVHTGIDFNHYKRSTIIRRITRRMQIRNVEELSAYLAMLGDGREEVRALAEDLLITVTNFFRDGPVFESLARDVLPPLFEGKGPEDEIRAWSVGCATGEEAYSLAILLLEEAARRDEAPRIQVFASDLHAGSIARARDGFYPGEIAADVSADRLARFFHVEDGGYRIRKDVREKVVFTPHNLLGDPPFSRLDLIVCRNVLIYLRREVQRGVAELFHYALRPNGVLVLGTSETIDGTDLFVAEDKRLCLYRKRNVPPQEPRLPVFAFSRTPFVDETVAPLRLADKAAYGSLHQRVVERYGPPSLLLNADDRIVHLSDHAGRYLVHPGGEITAHVFKLLRADLRIDLRALLQTVRERREPARSRPIAVHLDGRTVMVVIDVRPALDAHQDGFALVLFDEHAGAGSEVVGPGQVESLAAGLANGERVRELATELELARRRLEINLQEYETSQEEMKAANEELQSANEELRSTMEELETSKEELQSMNEELQTVNQEHRHKVEELAQLSSDLQNLLSATDIATFFLDRELRIMRFTPKVGELFNVRMTDRGRPLSDLTHRLGSADLLTDANDVLAHLLPIDREVRDEAGRWSMTRVLPYRTTAGPVAGVVITFVEITDRRRAEEALRRSEERLAAELLALQRMHDLVARLLVSPDQRTAVDEILQAAIEITGAGMGNVQLMNDAGTTLELYAQRGFATLFVDHFRTVTPLDDSACGRAMASRERTVIEDVETDPRFAPHRATAAAAGFRAVQSTPLLSHDGELLGMLSTHYPTPHRPSDYELRMLDLYARQAADYIERVRNEQAVRVSEERMQLTLRAAHAGSWHYDAATDLVHLDDAACAILEAGANRMARETLFASIHPVDRARITDAIRETIQTKHHPPFTDEVRVARADGTESWIQVRGQIFVDEASGGVRLVRAAGVVLDVTLRRRNEEALHEKSAALEQEAKSRERFLATLGHELRNPLAALDSAMRLIERGIRTPEQVQTLLGSHIRQLTNLVNDLLDVSRIAHGKITLNVARTDLVKVVQAAARSVQSSIRVREQDLRLTLTERVEVQGDATRLEQIVANLLTNASKFTADGGRIDVTIDRDDRQATIAVRDEGRGLERDQLETIFEPFTQGSAAGGGLGIGLALVRSLVELHGGTVTAESEGLGRGSLFAVQLPIGLLTEDGESAVAPWVAACQLSAKLRVLVVDDLNDAADTLALLLESVGAETTCAYNGADGLRMAETWKPDVAIVDIGLPDITGYEVAEQIRAAENGQRMLLLAVTGYSDSSTESRARDAGFDARLLKPISFDALHGLLEEHLAHNGK